MNSTARPSTLAERLKQAMAARNLKQESLAEAAGVSQNTIHKLTAGKAQSTRKLIEIAAALGVSPVWLGTGEGSPQAATPPADGSPLRLEPLHPWDNSTPLDEDEVELPLYKEVEMSAGAGRTAVRQIEGRKLRFSYATLRAAGVDPDAAICAQLTGNSMEPLIMDGSTIGIDTATTHITDGEIYALEHEGMLRVKFLYRLPGGGIRLRSFNRDEYGDEEYDAQAIQASQLSIIGWVFWWSTVRHRRAPTLVR
ncbi:phage repressor protein C with HTH and peptisase S24 domain [Pseudomonas citronellolis]|uniref:XRE family transcriptional regulator n=1 Tax=Pseudomonas TaxID=286 RepID=UPI0020A0C34E|nr:MULTISPECIES: helix-turn-helix transcriptional regulator [Pseudomonas]MCP1646417.1 phage repressor protein C with HTH and peptisase S24 domain [Pseudomonas citronellolis]MCP1669369.1 phage repressor protein C with HTH and peptisase S24 domain [Pseudomonas citronellolis]MCP1701049.1 phage repressor protein C with HTH and peptisase S24 domain [Pseudomonas citronellolis]MCP1707226.1 phage repressor protein C with HTH and peptisase S24 domain [Pseudomonas citronellolis]MCP1801131.1 phage repres